MAVPSSTQRDSARLINAPRSEPRPARPSTSSMQACGYLSPALLSSAARRLSPRWCTSRSTINARRSSKLSVVLALLESCSSMAEAMPTSLRSRSCARVLFIIMGKSFNAVGQCGASVVVRRAAQVVVLGCHPLGFRRRTLDEVAPVGQDVAHMAVLPGTELQGQRAGSLDALRAVALG